jgi:hypothetical protein
MIRTAGRAAFQRAALLYLGIGIACAVLFAGNGMSAVDVTEVAASSTLFRVLLWSVWLLIATPAAHAVMSEPSLFLLRALPIPRAHFVLMHGLLLLFCELPMLILFVRGAGLGIGLSVLATAMSAHALIVTKRKTTPLLVAGIICLCLIALPVPLWLALPLSGSALLLSLPAAFVLAPERAVSSSTPSLRDSALAALSQTYFLTLWRGHGALFLRALWLLFVGIAIATLAIRNNEIQAITTRHTVALGTLSAVLMLALCSLAGPILRAERRAEWLLTVCQASGALRVQAMTLLLALFGLVLGVLFALPLGLLVRTSSAALLRLTIESAAVGITCAMLATGITRLSLRGTEKDTDRILVALIVTLLTVGVLTWMLGEWTIVAQTLLGLWLLLLSVSATSPSSRWNRLRREREQGEP